MASARFPPGRATLTRDDRRSDAIPGGRVTSSTPPGRADGSQPSYWASPEKLNFLDRVGDGSVPPPAARPAAAPPPGASTGVPGVPRWMQSYRLIILNRGPMA